MDESSNSLVNYQMAIPSAPKNHNNLYQSPLKDTFQRMTLNHETPCTSMIKTSTIQ